MLLTAAVAWALSYVEIRDPRTDGRRLADPSAVLGPLVVADLDSRVRLLADQMDLDMVVVELRTLETANPHAFASGLARAWQIGSTHDGGVLILLVDDRKLVEVEAVGRLADKQVAARIAAATQKVLRTDGHEQAVDFATSEVASVLYAPPPEPLGQRLAFSPARARAASLAVLVAGVVLVAAFALVRISQAWRFHQAS